MKETTKCMYNCDSHTQVTDV